MTRQVNSWIWFPYVLACFFPVFLVVRVCHDAYSPCIFKIFWIIFILFIIILLIFHGMLEYILIFIYIFYPDDLKHKLLILYDYLRINLSLGLFIISSNNSIYLFLSRFACQMHYWIIWWLEYPHMIMHHIDWVVGLLRWVLIIDERDWAHC